MVTVDPGARYGEGSRVTLVHDGLYAAQEENTRRRLAALPRPAGGAGVDRVTPAPTSGRASLGRMSQLFTPIRLRDLEIRNRVWVSPMCQYSSRRRHARHDWHLVHLGSFARGGAGLVFTEATAVAARGAHLAGRRRHLERRAAGGLGAGSSTSCTARARVAGIQLAHAGRKASTAAAAGTAAARSPTRTAAGGRSRRRRDAVPRAAAGPRGARRRRHRATSSTAFARRGRRALAAGFDVLELHAAHGYLLHEFLSPLSNQRDDEYGGSLRRTASGCCSRSSTRCATPCPAARRSSSASPPPTGSRAAGTSSDSVRLAGLLKRRTASTSSTCSQRRQRAAREIPVGPGYQVDFARRVRAEAGIADRRGRDDHRAQAGRGDRRRPGRPTSCCSPARCCATRTGRCAPPTSSASRSARASSGRSSTSAPRWTSAEQSAR